MTGALFAVSAIMAGALALPPRRAQGADAVWPEPVQNSEQACASAHPAGPEQGSRLDVTVTRDGGLYRGGEVVTIADAGGHAIVSLLCSGPILSFRLWPGRYRATAAMGRLGSADVPVTVPPQGAQVTLALQPRPVPPFIPGQRIVL